VGRDPGTIRRSFSGPCLVSTSQEQIEQFANRMPGGRGIVGTPEQVVEQLKDLAGAVVGHFQLVFSGFPDTAPIELFIDKVLPRVKAL